MPQAVVDPLMVATQIETAGGSTGIGNQPRPEQR
jgi:hypothetical protein